MKKIFLLSAAASLLVLAGGDIAPVPVSDDGVEWSLTPYLWVASLQGDLPGEEDDAQADQAYADVVSSLDMVFMGYGEVRKGNFGLFGDIFFYGQTIEADIVYHDIAIGSDEIDIGIYTLAGFYRVLQGDGYYLDAVAGMRYWDIQNKLMLGSENNPLATIEGAKDWNNALVGAKGRVEINENWYLNGWVFATLADKAEYSTDIYGGVGYNYSDMTSFFLGYRQMSVGYEINRRFVNRSLDLDLGGPIAGVTFKF